jgi:hypothetical protein
LQKLTDSIFKVSALAPLAKPTIKISSETSASDNRIDFIKTPNFCLRLNLAESKAGIPEYVAIDYAP